MVGSRILGSHTRLRAISHTLGGKGRPDGEVSTKSRTLASPRVDIAEPSKTQKKEPLSCFCILPRKQNELSGHMKEP